MATNNLMSATLIYDQSGNPTVPSQLMPDGGTAAIVTARQMDGTPLERLCEIAGRACYDSFGRGRTSADFHKHILEVGHLSVIEHAVFTVRVNVPVVAGAHLVPELMDCLNRPSLWVEARGFRDQVQVLRLTLNLRHVLEWSGRTYWEVSAIPAGLWPIAHALAPAIVAPRKSTYPDGVSVTLVPPFRDEEKWVTLLLTGSRGMSHELVRHGDFTAISQRCISGDAEVTFVNAKGAAMPHLPGCPRTIESLYRRMRDPRLAAITRKMKPRVLDESTGLFKAGKLLDVIASGVKPCFTVTLENASSITCTKDHKIWTNLGWQTLEEIAHPILHHSVVAWDRSTIYAIGLNGLSVAGLGLYRDKEWLNQRHNVERVGIPAMARESECSYAVIRSWLRRYGLTWNITEINSGRVPWNKNKEYSHTRPYSPETIERYRQSKLGSKNPQWRGGVFSQPRREFQAWKRKNGSTIFTRDQYRCLICGRKAHEVAYNSRHTKRRQIEIQHIMPMWNRPDLACHPGNMATVCWKCHVSRLNGHEADYAPALLAAINSPLPYKRSERLRPQGKRQVRVHYSRIASIKYAGEVPTYDLVLEGPDHGFVANGIVVHNSTRYVNEAESPWVDHPLALEFFKSMDVVNRAPNGEATEKTLKQHTGHVANTAKRAYRDVVDKLEPWLVARGVDKTTARKQARGAARGYLGNALYTEVVFSASVAQWKHMLRMRASAAADAEIREVFCQALRELKRSQYGNCFEGWETISSPDGIGQVLAVGTSATAKE